MTEHTLTREEFLRDWVSDVEPDRAYGRTIVKELLDDLTPSVDGESQKFFYRPELVVEHEDGKVEMKIRRAFFVDENTIKVCAE